MTGIFVGLFTEAQLLEIIATAKADAAAGKSVISYTAAGVSVTKDRNLSPQDVLLEARYALQILNPTLYGRSLITKRTQAQFN